MSDRIGARVFISACLVLAAANVTISSINPILALFTRSIGAQHTWEVGLAVGIFGCARFLLTVPAGILADRYGRNVGLCLGGLIAAIGNFMCSVSGDFTFFVISRFIAGAGLSMILTIVPIVLVDISTPENRGRTMSVSRSVAIFALGVSPYPGSLLATHWGVSTAFLFNVGIAVLAAVVAIIFIPDTRPANVMELRARRNFRADLRMLFDTRGFLMATSIGFVASLALSGGMVTLAPLLGSDRMGLAGDSIGLSITVASVAGLIAAYPAGMLVDRFGHKFVLVPASIAGAGVFGLLSHVASFEWFLASYALWGVASGMIGLSPVAYVSELVPRSATASAVSTYYFISDLGFFLGPVFIGLLVDTTGVNITLWLIAGAMLVPGLLFASLAPSIAKARSSAPA